VEQVTFWIDELFKGSVAEGAKVRVRTIRARVKCESCGYKGGIISDQQDHFQHGEFFRELDAPQLCCGVLHWSSKRVSRVLYEK